ncbi:MAG: hypothetical protein ACUVXI_16460 [bacterium]
MRNITAISMLPFAIFILTATSPLAEEKSNGLEEREYLVEETGFAVAFRGGTIIPIGDGPRGAFPNVGLALGGDIGFGIYRELDLGLSLDYVNQWADIPATVKIADKFGKVVRSEEQKVPSNLSIFCLSFMPRYRFIYSDDQSAIPYVGGGVGYGWWVQTIERSALNGEYGSTQFEDRRVSNSKMAYHLALGSDFQFNEPNDYTRLSFVTEARYSMLQESAVGTSQRVNLLGPQITVGLSLRFTGF